MKRAWTCRRTFVALCSLVALTALGWHGADVAPSIATIALALCGANAAEAVGAAAMAAKAQTKDGTTP